MVAESKIEEQLGILVLKIIVLISGVVLFGLVVSVYWSWFVSPIFSVKSITIAQSLGLTAFIRVLIPTKEKDHDSILDEFLESLVKALVLLIYGYCLHFFV